MIQVAKDDVLRGLKKFKRLAKQDLLASGLTSNPDFWRVQAESRRQKYSDLMELVEAKGVDLAFETAAAEYAKLPLFDTQVSVDPQLRGTEQALEMFFTLLGMSAQDMQELRASGSLMDGSQDWQREKAMEV
ncbi:MAG: hypothetical protein GX341_08665 [Firmicutes bacterium]|jgi:hypothetical protein|nr:hypothetical protein [Bacillota bacterium]